MAKKILTKLLCWMGVLEINLPSDAVRKSWDQLKSHLPDELKNNILKDSTDREFLTLEFPGGTLTLEGKDGTVFLHVFEVSDKSEFYEIYPLLDEKGLIVKELENNLLEDIKKFSPKLC